MNRSNAGLLLVAVSCCLVSFNLACGSDAASITITNGDGGDAGGHDGGNAADRAGSDAAVTQMLNDTFTTTNSLAGYAFSDYPRSDGR